MATPTEGYPEWATNDVTETVLIGGVSVLVTNVVVPTQEFKDSGLLAREPMPRPYTNYMFKVINKWIQHLDNRYAIGDMHATLDSNPEDAAAISIRLGGTWVARGSSATGTVTSNWFEKTA